MSSAQRGGAKARQKLISNGESHGVAVWHICKSKQGTLGVVHVGGRRVAVQHLRANVWKVCTP